MTSLRISSARRPVLRHQIPPSSIGAKGRRAPTAGTARRRHCPPGQGPDSIAVCKAATGLGAWLSAVGGGRSAQVRRLKEELLAAIVDTKFGAKCSKTKRQEIEELIQNLEEVSGGDRSPTRGRLAGRWNLLYTTETQVHSIVNGLLLGLGVQNISQAIDLKGLRVTNAIDLSLGVGLKVGAPATVEGPQRIAYEFDSAALTVAGLELKFSPKGKGWTEAVFCDDSLRVMRNSRGDTLIFSREK